MQQKAFTLQNKGMNRDLSISKAGESSAYENHNIRITATDHDTLLSVTNERGTKEVVLNSTIEGTLIGWNVLNKHIILFTHEDPNVDRIYRVDYDGENFRVVYGAADYDSNNINTDVLVLDAPIFQGDLGFNVKNPIESVVYFETEAIQKIYWVDGLHVLRFMNFMASRTEVESWDKYTFDSNRFADFDVNVEISKDYSGNTRANGVVQYLLTYYNKHGQETGYVWISDLVYLSPKNIGGAADGTNNCRVTLSITFDKNNTFDSYRVYSIFRSALNGEAIAYLVGEGSIGSEVTVIDDGAHLTTEDVGRMLYLGSQNLIASTLAHKDQTLFLGGLESTGQDYSAIKQAISDSGMYDHDTGLTSATPDRTKNWIYFEYSSDIPYTIPSTQYEYNSQLEYGSSKVLTFKGGEKYRFGVVFKKSDGSDTSAFWIGDAINTLYPVIDANNNVIKRVVARCTLPVAIYDLMPQYEFVSAQVVIAEATYADRSVKAQGIINPTVFNVWDRFNNRLYGMSSWISRPRGSGFAFKHFAPINNSTESSGEIDCNYWTSTTDPAPYYQLVDYNAQTPSYDAVYDGMPNYDKIMVVYEISCYKNWTGFVNKYRSSVFVLMAKVDSGNESKLEEYVFPSDFFARENETRNSSIDYIRRFDKVETVNSENQIVFSIFGYETDWFENNTTGDPSKKKAYNDVVDYLQNDLGLTNSNLIVDYETFYQWCEKTPVKDKRYFNLQATNGNSGFSELQQALNGVESTGQDFRNRTWISENFSKASKDISYTPAYYKKHLMFVDENLITLDSPELAYEAISFDKADGYKLRIVGAAKITGGISDYVVDAQHSKLSGENLIKENFGSTVTSGNLDGLISWPLWAEKDLDVTDDGEKKELEDRTSSDYTWGPGITSYWLHMWNHAGKISGFTDEDGSDYSLLHSKIFANLRFAGTTVYDRNAINAFVFDETNGYLGIDSLRVFNSVGSQYYNINISNETRYYNGSADISLSMPGSHRYPVLNSGYNPDPTKPTSEGNAYLYLKDPVQIAYLSSLHAVIALHTSSNQTINGLNYPVYMQDILPRMFDSETYDNVGHNPSISGPLVPWINVKTDAVGYPYKDYYAFQKQFELHPDSDSATIEDGDRYLFIGEIYQEFTGSEYGGITDSDIEKNRFISAGAFIRKKDMQIESASISHGAVQTYGYSILADQGDTYFQRWDCLKTKPTSNAPVNGVIDITSVMLESHINLDGRTDLQRGISALASINTEQFGSLNPVYSQTNNFFAKRNLDEDFDQDTYKSSITWTLDKSDSAEVDEWTHITLANTLKLDGDKGACRAIRRFQNSLIAFQDRAISEILFNSRTQIATTDGVPIEIANSGKVDGKRYISNKYGCTNKWSIVEGKAALYFVDNINKAFCAFNGNINALSTEKGFNAWFRRRNNTEAWTPDLFNNFVSFYDRVNSDVYLVGKEDEEGRPTLVYNELLGEFTSFYDYDSVPMMANVEDRFVSFKNNKLWLQNEGLYCNFFGSQYDYWIQYRVTPNPYTDKIWSGIDYRADFYRVLDEDGTNLYPESEMIRGDYFDDNEGVYQENTTFDNLEITNEYQKANIDFGKDYYSQDPARKKFRIWRLTIPRAQATESNKYGLDRIRNPWINLTFKKKLSESNDADANKDLMQLHDMIVRYFE